MTHKVHPKAFRIRGMEDWSSRGFYGGKTASYLEEDFKIREFLKKKIGKMGMEKIEIERSAAKIDIIIYSARPGLIIGRGGEGVEALKKELEGGILRKGAEIKLEIREVRNLWASAPLAAQWIVGQIEKRTPFRRVMKQAIAKIMAQKGVQGARVGMAGRLDGAEIARKEWLREGRLPRQTLRADIDYALEEAHCTYGIVGIKVWIYKGERF